MWIRAMLFSLALTSFIKVDSGVTDTPLSLPPTTLPSGPSQEPPLVSWITYGMPLSWPITIITWPGM